MSERLWPANEGGEVEGESEEVVDSLPTQYGAINITESTGLGSNPNPNSNLKASLSMNSANNGNEGLVSIPIQPSTDEQRHAGSVASDSIQDPQPIYRYQLLKGKYKFYCDGHIIMNRDDYKQLYMTLFLIVFPFSLFLGFEAKFAVEKMTIACPIIMALLVIMAVSALLSAACSDPGIIPRTKYAIDYDPNNPLPTKYLSVILKGREAQLKYCYTCGLWRPLRSSHCSYCDHCIERFDHHCPWVGNCIGKRNYRFFFTFILLVSILSILAMLICIWHLVNLAENSGAELIADKIRVAFATDPAAVILIFFLFMIGCVSVGPLTIYHTILVVTHQTTNEKMKINPAVSGIEGRNPYTRGICWNVCFTLFGPRSASWLRRTEKIIPDDSQVDNSSIFSFFSRYGKQKIK